MFGPEIDRILMNIARENPDEEMCGFIVNGEVITHENRAEDKANSFYINEPTPDGIQAVWHTHGTGPFYPSKSDMEQQKATALPWAIAAANERHAETFWFGDQTPRAPLVGRGFRHGVTDCYALIRDFYLLQYGIVLKEYPRDWEWWHGGEDMYEVFFKDCGWSEVPKERILPGDGFLATIRSPVINHAGIYLGNGLILHHTCGSDGYDPFRLSVVEPGARWFNYLTKVVRYADDTINRAPVNLW